MPMLDVPYVGQWGVGANHLRTDCGVAAVAGCLDYFHLRGNLTVDALATETPLSQHDNGLATSDLVTLAGRHGLTAHAGRNITLDNLRTDIIAGRPVIVLVAYRFISGRLDQADNNPLTDGHYLTIVGFDDNHFVANDSDYWIPFTEQGHDVLIPIAELDMALSASGRQAVFMENPMPIPDQIAALITEAEATLDQAKVLAGQITTVPAPIPGTTMYTTAALNMRDQPSTVTGKVMGTLLKGDKVQVEDAPNATGWKKIVYGPFTGWFVSAAYLTVTVPNP